MDPEPADCVVIQDFYLYNSLFSILIPAIFDLWLIDTVIGHN